MLMDGRRGGDFLKLHFIVLLWGFTAVIGKWVQQSAVEVVLIRSGIASIVLAAWMWRELWVPARRVWAYFGTGMLIGLHWITFFASAKVANVSVCMVGMATISLWTAVLEPVFLRGKEIRRDELALGVVIVAAVYWIYRGDSFREDPRLAEGLFLAITSALLATVFSIFNGGFARHCDHRVIVAYEMAGAAALCATALFTPWLWDDASQLNIPSIADWAGLLVLAIVCTVYAYSQYVELLKRLTVFTINFANNLEPVYGIVLGAIVFGDHERMDFNFYVGAAGIAALVVVQPLLPRRRVIG